MDNASVESYVEWLDNIVEEKVIQVKLPVMMIVMMMDSIDL